MLIPPRALSLMGVHPTGVLHIGAHEAEESPTYQSQHWGPVTWVEMLPDKAAALRKRFADDPQNAVIEAACWSSETTLTIHRADNGQSSSLLEPSGHLEAHPEVGFSDTSLVVTKRLDNVLPHHARFDFVNIDAQGAELQILLGLGSWIEKVKWAYVEVNEKTLYDGCALLPDLDAYFRSHGFVRAFRWMAGGHVGWGDGLYIRTLGMTPGALWWLKARCRVYHAWQRLVRPISIPEWDNW